MSNHDSGVIVDEVIGSLKTKNLKGKDLQDIAEKVRDQGGSVSACRLEKALMKMEVTISRDCRVAAQWLKSHGFVLAKSCFA